jgi:hypothetical protein
MGVAVRSSDHTTLSTKGLVILLDATYAKMVGGISRPALN